MSSTSTRTTSSSPAWPCIRLDGGLFFATCRRAGGPHPRGDPLSTAGLDGIVLDCEGIDFIDSQGSAKLGEIVDLAEDAGSTCGWPG